MSLMDEMLTEVLEADVEALDQESFEDMLIVVDQLEQTLSVMNSVVGRLKSQIEEIQENLTLELSAEEFLAAYEDPYAPIH